MLYSALKIRKDNFKHIILPNIKILHLSYLTEVNPGQPVPPLQILIINRECYFIFEAENSKKQ
jgi:hypothetical protein